MKTIIKICLTLIFATFFSCGNLTSQHDKPGLNTDSLEKKISGVNKINGKYCLDTNVIASNSNLQNLINDLEKTKLDEIKNIAEIPDFIISFLNNLTGNFSIANPGEDWQASCCTIAKVDKNGNVISTKKPERQLLYFGLGQTMALMAYYTGGVGISEHILIIKFSEKNILDFWCCILLSDLKTKSQILNYIKESSINEGCQNSRNIFL